MKSSDVAHVSSTGQVQQSIAADTTVATIPIYMIKQANAKLIERKYFIDIINQQDSIIADNKLYRAEQTKIINDLHKRLVDASYLNESINKKLNKRKKIDKIFFYVVAGTVIGLTTGLISK